MIGLAAAVCFDIPSDEFQGRIRELLDQPLRRSGVYAKLCVAGIRNALVAHETRFSDWAGSGLAETAVVWSSVRGAFADTQAVLAEIAKDEEVMPFDFIATMPVMPAALSAQLDPTVTLGAFVPVVSTAGATWRRMLALAAGWLIQHRCQRVACGWVEESSSPDVPFRSHWVVVVPARTSCGALDLANLFSAESGLQSQDWEVARFVPSVVVLLESLSPQSAGKGQALYRL